MKATKKHTLSCAAVAVAGMLGMSAAVQADPVSFIKGPFEFKYSNFEFAQQPANGVNVGGIFSLTGIDKAGTNTVWWNPQPFSSPASDGTELNGFFSNITITSGSNPSFTATGGLLSIYNVAFGNYKPATFSSAGIDPTTQLCGGPCPTPWLTTLFVPGIKWPSDNTTTLAGSFLTTTPISGTGNGYMSVADLSGMTVTNGNGGSNFLLPAGFVGSNNFKFDTNGFVFSGVGAPSAADFLLGSRFFQCGVPNEPSSCGQVNTPRFNTASSDDPVRGNTIPEPGTLALLGISLVGMAAVRRGKRSKA